MPFKRLRRWKNLEFFLFRGPSDYDTYFLRSDLKLTALADHFVTRLKSCWDTVKLVNRMLTWHAWQICGALMGKTSKPLHQRKKNSWVVGRYRHTATDHDQPLHLALSDEYGMIESRWHNLDIAYKRKQIKGSWVVHETHRHHPLPTLEVVLLLRSHMMGNKSCLQTDTLLLLS